MNSQILSQLNEAYRHGVYAEETLSEETLSEEELADITQWVESLVQEGYDLDQFSDEELYAAYLEEAKGEGPEHAKPGTKTYQSVFRGYKPKSPSEKEAMHRGSGSKAKRRAENMEESADLYDIVSEYLVSEGFCNSYEDADVIMANMSEEWRESIMEEVLDEVNRPEREMIKKGLLKPGRQVARIRNLNRQSGNTNWYAADPRDTRAIKTPGKGGVFNSRQRREQEADAFNTSRRRREHEFDQDSSRARKTGDWSKVDKKRPLGGHKTKFEKERDERNSRTVYGD
jgi:hypothetical protein